MSAPFPVPAPRHLFSALILSGTLLPAVAFGAWSHDPYVYAPIAPSAGDQVLAQTLTDGAGGAFFLFTDTRNGPEDVYVQRLDANGVVAAGWPAGGVRLAAISSQKLEPQMVNDASGGVIAVWTDNRSGNADIYAQRVLGNGTLAGGSWPATGLQLSSLADTERRPQICTDGAGGAMIAWESSYSSTDTDIYGAHVTTAGSISFDQTLDNGLADARSISVASDAAGGYFVVYQDSSSAFTAHPRIFGLRTNGSGSVLTSPSNIVVNSNSFSDFRPQALSDGSGGVWVIWVNDMAMSAWNLLFHRFGASLSPSSFNGALTGGLSTPFYNAAPDGAGGFVYTWVGQSIGPVVGRMTPVGPAIGWPVDYGYFGSSAPAGVVADGSGGAIVGYSSPLLVRRARADGGTVTHWASAVTARAGSGMSNPTLVTDGAHGAIVGWYEGPPSTRQVYAARVDHFGALGKAEPAITSIADVAGDQGGHVRLVWNASYLDADPYFAVGYSIWRQTPASLAAAEVQRGGRWVDGEGSGTADPAATRLFRHSASTDYAWELVTSLIANGSGQYSYVAPTSRDSLPSSNPKTSFMVEARWTGGDAFWDSAPDSGYSVDNLAPGPPAQLAARWYSGTSVLTWMPNLETDLYGYRVYRGTTSAFVPGSMNRVASPPDTGYVDPAGAAYWYKVSAVDIHGNESAFATVLPQGVSGLPPGEAAPRLALAVASSNPASGQAVLRIDLTKGGPVRLVLYDAAGRLVRTVVAETLPAGQWFRKWNGLDQEGHAAPSGPYFARLEAEGRSLMQRIALIR